MPISQMHVQGVYPSGVRVINARALEKYYEDEWRVKVKGDLLTVVLKKFFTFGWTPSLT
jgi:hypothetical protein